MGAHIDWTPHPDDQSYIFAHFNGWARGYVRCVCGVWVGVCDYTDGPITPSENTEPAARAAVEAEIRRAVEEM